MGLRTPALTSKIPAIRLDKDSWVTQLGADVWDDEFQVLLEQQLCQSGLRSRRKARGP